MGYAFAKEKGKAPITSDQIGSGQVQIHHLDAGLYAEINNISLHAHTGTRSRKVSLRNLEGSFGIDGFYMYSKTGAKRFKVQLNDDGTWSVAEG